MPVPNPMLLASKLQQPVRTDRNCRKTAGQSCVHVVPDRLKNKFPACSISCGYTTLRSLHSSYETDKMRFYRTREHGGLAGGDANQRAPLRNTRLGIGPYRGYPAGDTVGTRHLRIHRRGHRNKRHQGNPHCRLPRNIRGRPLPNRVFELSQTHSQVALKQIHSTPKAALFYEQIASSILYANALFRSDAASIIANHRGQSGLWGYSISGDLPIVLFTISDTANIEYGATIGAGACLLASKRPRSRSGACA